VCFFSLIDDLTKLSSWRKLKFFDVFIACSSSKKCWQYSQFKWSTIQKNYQQYNLQLQKKRVALFIGNVNNSSFMWKNLYTWSNNSFFFKQAIHKFIWC
jgi:hypothetical protein